MMSTVGVCRSGGVEQRVLDGSGDDGDGDVEAGVVLQLVDAGAGLLALLRLELLFEVELERQAGVGGGNGVEDAQVGVGLLGGLARVAKDALGVFAEANGAEPFSMVDGVGDGVRSVTAGEYG